MVLKTRGAASQATSHQQIINKADAELATISQQIAAAQGEVSKAQEELGNIAFRRSGLQKLVNQAHEQLQKVQASGSQCQTFAELAQGTPSEASAIASLETARQEVQQREQVLASAQRNQVQEEAQLSQREQALGALVIERNNTLATLSQRRVSFQTAREQAHEELGQETYERIAAQLQALSEQVTKQGRGLIDKKLEMKAARDAALAALSPWRHLQEKIAELNVYEDATTRLLNTYLAFLDTLERECKGVKREIYVDKDAGHVNIYAMCALSAVDLQNVGDYGTAELNKRRELINRFLATHTRGKVAQ